jgi:hypothetical protein
MLVTAMSGQKPSWRPVTGTFGRMERPAPGVIVRTRAVLQQDSWQIVIIGSRVVRDDSDNYPVSVDRL